MAEQVDLMLLDGAKSPRHRLRWRVFAIDAVEDLVEVEGGKRPVDRRPRRLERVAFAAKLAGNTPADLKNRPTPRKQRFYPTDIFSAGFFLDHKHPRTLPSPIA